MHTQFIVVLSHFFSVAKKRTKKEKIGAVQICAALSADSEDSDVEDNADDDDEEGGGVWRYNEEMMSFVCL